MFWIIRNFRNRINNIHHWSICAVYNYPDFPGPYECDCGAAKAARKWWSFLGRLVYIWVVWRMSLLKDLISLS
jgi:hypothetical protein